MTYTTTRTFPTTQAGNPHTLAAVYEYERLDREAMAAYAFIRENGHNPEMHRACRNAQRRYDSWLAKINAHLRSCDMGQRLALLALTDLNEYDFAS